MNTESNKVLLVGTGETGLDIVRIVAENEVKGITGYGIKKESELESLVDDVIKDAELVILVADLGKAKDNSLALQASKWAKDGGKTVAAILTTPRLFEGEKTIMRALETAQEIGQMVDSSLIINKENFNTLPKEGRTFEDLINSLVPEEEVIAGVIQNMMNLISESEAIKIDLEDLKAVLADSATFTIENGLGAGENRMALAIEGVLTSPLMKKCDISTARKVLIKILAPKNSPVTAKEMMAVADFIEKLPRHVDVKWGLGEAEDDNILSAIVFATGCDVRLSD